MPITSFDQLIRQSTLANNSCTVHWQISTGREARSIGTTRVADLASYLAAPNSPHTFPSLNGDLTWTPCNSSATWSIPAGPRPAANSGETKHIVSATVLTVSSTTPARLILVDLQGYWPNVTPNGTITLSGSPLSTLRYPNGDGLVMYGVQTNTGGINVGISYTATYTNQAGVTGRVIPVRQNNRASEQVGILVGSGVLTANNPGPFMALAGPDTGVQNVESITAFGNTDLQGRFAICLAKPLLSISASTPAIIIEKDFVNQFPLLPRVRDDACLVWLFDGYVAAPANSHFYGTIDYVWG